MLNLNFTLEKVIFLTVLIESYNIPTTVLYTVRHIYIHVEKTNFKLLRSERRDC